MSRDTKGNYPEILQGLGLCLPISISSNPCFSLLLFFLFFFFFFFSSVLPLSVFLLLLLLLLSSRLLYQSCFLFLNSSFFLCFFLSCFLFFDFFPSKSIPQTYPKLMLLSFFGCLLLLSCFASCFVGLKKRTFLVQVMSCDKTVFFRNPCFQQCEKLVFCGLPILLLFKCIL